MSGYWRTSGAGDQQRKSERSTERADDRDDDNSGDNSGDNGEQGRADGTAERAGVPFRELSVEEQADQLRGPQLPEDLCFDVAREWKHRIDGELVREIAELTALPAFGPVLQGLADPVIAYDTIYRPGMDPDDPDGRETAETWTELGYSLQIKGYRPLYAENLAYLLRVQLASARIESTEATEEGTIYQLRTGLVGENGKHAILVSRWLVRPDGQRPELLRVWPELLPELPSGDTE